MSTYKNLIGKPLKYLTTNLSNDAAEGQVWYNSATGKLRTFLSYDTWATSSPMNTGRSALGGGGTQTAAWAAAGYISDYTDKTEEYNGSGWATSGDTNTPRSELGAGNVTPPGTTIAESLGSPAIANSIAGKPLSHVAIPIIPLLVGIERASLLRTIAASFRYGRLSIIP